MSSTPAQVCLPRQHRCVFHASTGVSSTPAQVCLPRQHKCVFHTSTTPSSHTTFQHLYWCRRHTCTGVGRWSGDGVYYKQNDNYKCQQEKQSMTRADGPFLSLGSCIVDRKLLTIEATLGARFSKMISSRVNTLTRLLV